VAAKELIAVNALNIVLVGSRGHVATISRDEEKTGVKWPPRLRRGDDRDQKGRILKTTIRGIFFFSVNVNPVA